MLLQRDVIVVGASAGGVEALRALVTGLPHDLEAAVAVVLHLPPGAFSALAGILDRAGPLPAAAVRRPTRVEPGRVYVAPPSHHLLMAGDEFVLSHGPTENGHRPSINALFRSAAVAAGPRAIGVVLSGALDDGASGLASIVARGGAAVVQDPVDALHGGMPNAALLHVPTATVAPAERLGPVLAGLVQETGEVTDVATPDELLTEENRIASGSPPLYRHDYGGSAMGAFSCPDCAGALHEVEPGSTRYRCRVGHGWSADALLDAQEDTLERALWTAVRTLEEKVALAERMRDRSLERGARGIAERYADLATESRGAATVLRAHLLASTRGAAAIGGS